MFIIALIDSFLKEIVNKYFCGCFVIVPFRVKDYIAGGLSCKIRDPDGGIHLAKVKAGLGLMEEVDNNKLKV